MRSRAKWFELGEKSSKYFHALVAACRLSSSISRLQTSEGHLVSGTNSVVGVAGSFYEKLCSAGPVVAESQDTLLSSLDYTLSLEQVQALEAPFTIDEVMQAIKHSSSSSSPGRDGLPFPFYKAFGECFAELLTELYNQVWTVGKIQSSALSCVIFLIFKQKGDEADLKNWRPISLSNCDLKILTKLLAHCLQASVSSLIHPSQTGFI